MTQLLPVTRIAGAIRPGDRGTARTAASAADVHRRS